MNYKTAQTFLLFLLLTPLVGCHSGVNASASPQPVQPSTSANPQTPPNDCAAITDPAAHEDCQFRAEVLKKRQKSNATPVVVHDPGSIKQP